MECIIFDLDGVLTETSEQHYQAWKALATDIGIHINKEFNEKLKGISRMESLERILEYGKVADKYTDEEKLLLVDKKNKQYVESIKNLKPEDAYVGADALLKSLKEEGFKIALASASKNAPFIIQALKLDQYFDYIVDPSTIKKGKPAPDIFLAAAEYLGVSPSKCIGVEDSEAGIQAIKQAGMYAIGIGEKNILRKADIVYGKISDIRKIF